MIDIVNGEEFYRRQQSNKEMHKLRYRVFKERLEWDVPVHREMEIDQFDGPDALYLLAYNSKETLVGTWRLLPTLGPYMLRDVFPALLEGKMAPSHHQIWETSRFAVESSEDDQSSNGRHFLSSAVQEMFCGLIELCVWQGIKELYTVYDILVARLLPRVGVLPNWTSQKVRIGNTIALAGSFDTTPQTLERVRKRTGIQTSVIRSIPWSLLNSREAA